ncbi:unnamed protein product [Dicrocoelium dendriticum]|nr:unnamed protein product [Dicrocoelium dendriticum]
MGMPSYVKENLKSAQLILESLKRDHEQALLSLNSVCPAHDCTMLPDGGLPMEAEKTFNLEKIPLIKSALSRIQSGLDDSEVLFTFARYAECMEAENARLNLHNQRLCEETSWLRDELKFTQAKLCEKESLLAQTLVQKRHLEFMLELTKYEDTDSHSGRKIDEYRKADAFVVSRTDHPPTMCASVLGLVNPNNLFGSIENQRDPQRYFSKHTLNSISTSQHLDLSAYMGSSLIDCDSTPPGCIQTYHSSVSANDEIRRAATAPSVPARLQTLHRMVMQYTSQNKYEVAASLCTRAIEDLQRAGGRDQTEIAALLNILALVYRNQGKYDEASKLLHEVLTIRERLFDSYHPSIAAALNNLAVMYAKGSRFHKAEPLCRRALVIREKLLGPDHPDVAKQLNNLALLCQNLGRFDEVEVCFRRALDIYSKCYKPTSLIVLRTKNNLASTLLKRGNLSDAEALLKDVLSPDRRLRTLPPNHQCHFSMNSTGPCISEADSAVFSSSSAMSSYTIGDFAHEHSDSRPFQSDGYSVPLWLFIEQACREGRSQLLRLSKFDLTAWASDAQIDLSVVLNALRNLAIVYQRQGHFSQANLIRSWIQSGTADSPTVFSSTPLAVDNGKTDAPKYIASSLALPPNSTSTPCTGPSPQFLHLFSTVQSIFHRYVEASCVLGRSMRKCKYSFGSLHAFGYFTPWSIISTHFPMDHSPSAAYLRISCPSMPLV